jgi:hypothetical protein
MVKCIDGAYVDAEQHDEMVEYLRKNADISPPQSPHDGIHTCSRGCSKPGCTRTLRDTIEEQDQQIEALKRDVLEKTAELRNLKEVVADLRISAEDYSKLRMERIHDLNQMGGQCEEIALLQAQVERLTAFTTRTIIPNEELQARVERLTKAGDAFYESEIGYYGEQILNDLKHHSGQMCRDWNAAKEGKQP